MELRRLGLCRPVEIFDSGLLERTTCIDHSGLELRRMELRRLELRRPVEIFDSGPLE